MNLIDLALVEDGIELWQEDDGRNDLDLLPADIGERETQPQRGQPADGRDPAEGG